MFQFPRFPSTRLCVRREMMEVRSTGFPHSDICGSFACSRLPAAFRSDPRPSSALGTKASTVSPCSFARDTEISILFHIIFYLLQMAFLHAPCFISFVSLFVC